MAAKGTNTILAGILIMLGLALLAKGFESFLDTQSFLAESTRIPGTVVGFTKEPFIPSIVAKVSIFHPVVQFADSAGNPQKIKSHFGTRWKFYEPGESVKVLLNPQRPEAAVIDSFEDVWLKTSALLILGIPMLIGGVVLLFRPTRP